MEKRELKIEMLDPLKEIISNQIKELLCLRDISYADVRVEIGEGIGSYSEDGKPKLTSKDYGASLGVRVIAGQTIAAAGYFGRDLGIGDLINFPQVLREALEKAYHYARWSAHLKSSFVAEGGALWASVTSTELAPIEVHQRVVPAKFRIDPRQVTPEDFTSYICEAASAAKNAHPDIIRSIVEAACSLSRKIFASSEGALIDQSKTETGAWVLAIAKNDRGDPPFDSYHHIGNQRGYEALVEGENTFGKDLVTFAADFAAQVGMLASARPLPSTDKPMVVVTDPDFNTLLVHEIVGHPSELDRAMKKEAGYAGRSWFMKTFSDNIVGEKIGSELLSAFSDPTLDKGSYGHYLYDDEGTPARRVWHIRNGFYEEFMNSRETAKIFGVQPNGHYTASDATMVPLIRMSVTVFAPGDRDPRKIIAEVEHGYYICGHRIPSISESRENFRIAAQIVYEIKNGQLGEPFRDGGIASDSKDFFLSINAVGNDFQVFPIPNCGKGQPMQAKKLGNGGPTLRGRARLAGK